MEKKTLTINFIECSSRELEPADAALVDSAKKISASAYAPYSHFNVGCAIRLSNGVIVTGCNQENASFPCGSCAERIALSWAGADYPDSAPEVMAIAAHISGKFTLEPVTPCGACRQVILETEQRYDSPIRIIMYGEKRTLIMPSAACLIPFEFDSKYIEKA